MMRKVQTKQIMRQKIRKLILRNLKHRIKRIKPILCQVIELESNSEEGEGDNPENLSGSG